MENDILNIQTRKNIIELNKLQMKQNRKENSILIILYFFYAMALYLLSNNENMLFYGNILLLFIILYNCKISFFSLKTIIIVYTLFPLYFKLNFNFGYGLLLFTDNSNYLIMNMSVLIYNVCWLLVFNNTNILELEKNIYKSKINMTKKTAIILSLMAVLITIFALPSIPFVGNYERFKFILPGNCWFHVAMILLVAALPKFKESHIVRLCYLFVLAWFFLHYERVECLGLLAFLFIRYFNNSKIDMKKIFIIGSIGILMFIFMIYLESARTNTNFSIKLLAKKALVQSTASDVIYTYDRAIEYSNNHENLYGETYLKYPIEVIPFLEYDRSSIKILNRSYYTAGGEFILNEPYMNFGISGVIFLVAFELFILYKILSMKSIYGTFAFFTICFSVFRIVWYGISYVETVLCIFLPLILLYIKYMNKNYKKIEALK